MSHLPLHQARQAHAQAVNTATAAAAAAASEKRALELQVARVVAPAEFFQKVYKTL
jgi:hypothetical protein